MVESADLFMSEYGCSLLQFFHDFPPAHIKRLRRSIAKRQITEYIKMIDIHHTSDPKELINSARDLLIEYNGEKKVDLQKQAKVLEAQGITTIDNRK